MKTRILISGPCQIESRQHAIETYLAIKESIDSVSLFDPAFDFYYKSSYDKANRTSGSSQRGVGMAKGLEILDDIKQLGGKVLTDVHETIQCKPAAEVCDVLQIPAFLCRQTDLLLAAAETGKIINIKKGQFLAPTDVRHIFEKIPTANTWITERGTSFGYGRLVVDFTGIEIMKEYKRPVIFDATHSVQMPGALDGKSGGNRQFVNGLLRAAAAIGVDGYFIETHQDPDNAPSDGPNMLPLREMEYTLRTIMRYDALYY
jgi:2-dehydro-3-deoxyphosphooctonate aldolase (KDO 8-P synthase)